MLVRALAVVGLGLFAVAVAGHPAAAHARLISTDPPGGATLTEPPESVRLTFSEAIETTFAGVQVFAPDRQRVEAGEARVAGERVIVPLADDLPGGRYTVVFRVISSDGHPVKSQFRFTYDAPLPEPPSSEPASTEAASPAATSPTPTPEPADGSAPIDLEDAGVGTTIGLWGSRLLNYAALSAVLGMLLAGLHLLPGGFEAAHRGWVRRAGIAAVLWAVTGVALFVFALSSIAARPLPAALDPDLLGRFLQTRFAVTVAVQVSLALLCAALAVVARGRGVAVGAAAAALAGAGAIAWWGHAGTDELPALAQASAFAHVAAAGVWVGGLATLIVMMRDAAAPGAQAAARFSRVAGAAFVAVALTGVVNAMLHMGSAPNLWGTTWGRLVVAKVVVLAVIGAFAWRNRNVLLPRMSEGGDGATAAFRRFAAGEVLVMLTAFGLAAGLASGIPADAEAVSRVQSVVSQFGDGHINVTIDPAAVGDNVVHLYFLTQDGTQQEVSDASLTFTGEGQSLDAQLVPAGPGHYTVLSQQFPAAGEYEMRVAAEVEGKPLAATATVSVR